MPHRCKFCGMTICYCCPECGAEVTRHKVGCTTDPSHNFQWRGQRHYACGKACMDSYKQDILLGLVYGPFKIEGKFVSAAVFSQQHPRGCVYCGRQERDDS
jgi:hypothetical protein